MTTKILEDVARPCQIRHKTLSAYYSKLSDISSLFEGCSNLRRQNDPSSYTELLSKTICARQNDAIGKQNPRLVYGDFDGSQQESIDRILVDLLRMKNGSKNVLLLGDRSSSDLPVNTSRPGIDTRHVDSPVAVLRTVPWKILRTRIGDRAFRHLFLHFSVFVPLGNNCFRQISGFPVYDLYGVQERKGHGDGHAKRKRARDDSSSNRHRRKKRRGGADSPKQKCSKPSGMSPADTVISRQRMFYGQPARKPDGKSVPGLHPRHILNQIKFEGDGCLGDTAYLALFTSIFPCTEKGRNARDNPNNTLGGNPRRVAKMLEMTRELCGRHHRLDYAKIIRRCLARAQNHTIDGLQFVSHSQVGRFVTAILQQLLSSSTSGSKHNLQTICYHARRLINAKQFEPIDLHSIMQNLCVTDIYWVRIETDHNRTNAAEMTKRRELVELFVLWLFNEYLIPLLKNTFYITETAQTRYETVYYAHDEWSKAAKPHFSMLEADHLEPLTNEQKAFALQRPLGVSAVRLVPKANGFRPIVNLGRSVGGSGVPGVSARGTVKHSTANQALRGVHQVLTYEKDRKRDMLGSSLFGTNEIFAPIQDLRNELVEMHGKLPRLYFVKMDIKAAFDTIKQDKMMDVIDEIIDQDHDYILTLYCLLLPPASQASQGSARRLFKSRAMVDNDMCSSFGELASDVVQTMRNALIVDMARRKRLSRKACLDLLRTHIKNNVWQVGNRYFRQKEGIPQGSKISSILCSMFYAALERDYLTFFSKPGSRLLRYIDDFMYITDDYSLARQFVVTMSRGFPEYGAFISPQKTLVSFEWARDGQVLPFCVADTQGSSYFPFCGFLIDCQTLEMSMDCPRMITGHMKQSFALRFARHKGAAFVGWLSRQLENRNHVAYLDTIHNLLTTVHLNIYLNFATTAMKIPHYFPSSEDLTPRRARLIYDSILLSVGYTYIAGRARVRHTARWDQCPSRHHTIIKQEFEFLAKSAVLKILGKKAGRFKDVIHLLRLDLDKREYHGCAERFADVLKRGWHEVEGAKY